MNPIFIVFKDLTKNQQDILFTGLKLSPDYIESEGYWTISYYQYTDYLKSELSHKVCNTVMPYNECHQQICNTLNDNDSIHDEMHDTVVFTVANHYPDLTEEKCAEIKPRFT